MNTSINLRTHTRFTLRRLIIRISIVLALVLTIDQLTGFAFDKLRMMALRYGKTKPVAEYTMQEVRADVLIMGNSRASHHYVPSILEDSLKMSVYNCGNDGQSFAYSAAMIHAVLKRYTPSMIILDVENEQFDPVLNEYFQSDVLYPYVDSDSVIRSVLWHEDPLNRYKLRSKMYRNNSQLVDILKYMVLAYPYEKGYDALPAEGYNYPTVRKVHYNPSAPADTFMLHMLQGAIDVCRRAGVELVLVVSPKYQESNSHKVASYTSLAAMARSNELTFLDFGDYRQVGDSTFFKDAAHLNGRGAEEFTRRVGATLRFASWRYASLS